MKRFRIGTKYEYCPNGNYWTDISGIFDERLYLFCDCHKCNGKVYQLRPVDITKKFSKEKIEKFRKLNELDDIKLKINIENLDAVKKVIENK